MVGENLRKALDWLPQGRRLVTVVTDCDLSGHVAGWPALDALALREVDRKGCSSSTSASASRPGARSWRSELGAAAAAPAARVGPAASAVPPPWRRPAPALAHDYETV